MLDSSTFTCTVCVPAWTRQSWKTVVLAPTPNPPATVCRPNKCPSISKRTVNAAVAAPVPALVTTAANGMVVPSVGSPAGQVMSAACRSGSGGNVTGMADEAVQLLPLSVSACWARASACTMRNQSPAAYWAESGKVTTACVV